MAARSSSSSSSSAAAVLLAMTIILPLAAPSALAQDPAPAPAPGPSSSTSPCPAILDKIIKVGLSAPEVSQIKGALNSLSSLRGAQCVCYVVLKSSNIGHGIGGIGGGGGGLGAGDPFTAIVEALLEKVGAMSAPNGFTCSYIAPSIED